MYYSDLSPCDYFPLPSGGRVLAVGWLEPGHDYRRGDVGPEFVRKLADLLAHPWEPWATLGGHSCGFCRLTGGPREFGLPGQMCDPRVRMGFSNLWVPGDELVFVAPSLILHYMDAHGYSPPDAFRAAVLACPPMRSMGYWKALLQNGPKGLLPGKR